MVIPVRISSNKRVHPTYLVVLTSTSSTRETDEVGKVIGQSPQVAILAHNAIGGFVSNCRWNMVLESLWFGAPLEIWLVYGEDGKIFVITTEEIENGIRQLMDDRNVRTKVKEMRKKSRVAVMMIHVRISSNIRVHVMPIDFS
uniref:Uncharacterized protein n=1 Tax=Lactuca sativa TaxID=4236 RepID=A0A9R1WHW0_LACSA|nr:hypothetical protein LSAT_V11C100032950 [Lactuca sativa]